MKILALNSSPRPGGASKTEMLLLKLAEGMREAGAQVEVVNLRQKKINFCQGCFSCWSRTPGRCIHKDDMAGELFPKWLEADMCVYASPLYHYSFNAAMKAFIERTLPYAEPFMVREDGGSLTHPQRQQAPTAVVLSVAGFPGREVFDLMSAYARFMFGHIGGLAAEIYRPAAEFLTMPALSTLRQDILAATAQAGRELVREGAVRPQTLEAVTRPLMPPDRLARAANMFWRTCIEEGVSPKQFGEKKMAIRPADLEDYLLMMEMGFNPRGAGDLQAVMQFDFSGSVQGSCHFTIEEGTIQGVMGPAPQPDLTVSAPFEVWMDVVTGKADGQQAFLEGKYQVQGDVTLLMRMGQLFG